MNKIILFIGLILAAAIPATAQVATGGNYTLDQSVIAGGGGQNASGANFSLDGTIGQPAAGTLSGGGFTLFGGFWTPQINANGLITISGRITSGGSPLSGVIVSLSGSSAASAVTDSNGDFSFTNIVAGGTYTVTPALTNYVFTPPNRQFTNVFSDQTANFTAAAQNCSYSINPTSASLSAGAANGTISVTTADGCNWTAVANDSWISITSAAANTNSGAVSYTVSANNGAARSGSITVAGQTFIITQAGTLYDISGVIFYGTTPPNEAAKFVSGVNLSAAGTSSASASTDADGVYLFDNLAAGDYTVTPSKTGDVNSISSFDASLTSRKAANLISLTGNQLIAADASNDGTVSSFDASLIARTASGVSNNGIAGRWKFVPASKNYPNLTANQTAQNYEAILVGEVSGNWMPPDAMNRAAIPTEAEQIEIDREEEIAYEKARKLFGTNYQTEISGETPKTVESFKTGGGIPVSLPANASASNGSVVSIPVTVGSTTGQGIFSFDFTVSFDPSVLTPASPAFDTTGTLSGAANFTITPNSATAGKLTISGFGTQELSGQGTLIFLRFNVVGAANSTTALTFDSFVFNEGTPAATTANGQFTVLGPTAANVSIAGRVLTANGRGLQNARVELTDLSGNSQTALTNQFGYFQFNEAAGGGIYILSVVSKNHSFQPQVISVIENLTDLIIVAEQKAAREKR